MACKVRKNKQHINEVSEVILQYFNKNNNTDQILSENDEQEYLLPRFIILFLKFKKYSEMKINITNIIRAVKNNYYEHLMINIAGLIIEQQIYYFITLNKNIKINGKQVLPITNVTNNTARGKIHDIEIEFNLNKDNNNIKLMFEVKSYNNVFGNITLTSNQRDENHYKDPIYILCNYNLTNGNNILVTEIYLLLGDDITGEIKDGKLVSKHLSVTYAKYKIFDINMSTEQLLQNLEK